MPGIDTLQSYLSELGFGGIALLGEQAWGTNCSGYPALDALEVQVQLLLLQEQTDTGQLAQRVATEMG